VYYKRTSGGDYDPFTQTTSEQKTEHYYYLNVFAKNNGKVLSEYINCYIQIPEIIFKEKFRSASNEDYERYILDNKFRDVVDIQVNYPHTQKKLGPARFEPMLPNTKLKLDSDFPLLHEFYHDHDALVVEWQVYADNAEAVSGKTKIKNIPIRRK
jgi:hypothetical protein